MIMREQKHFVALNFKIIVNANGVGWGGCW